MLKKLISSKTRIKVIEIFLFYPEKNFYLREIARLSKENTNSVRREIKNLLDLGFIRRYRKGKFIFYETNKLSPLYEPLKIMFLRTDSLGFHLSRRLKNKKIKYALIYGSFAAGKETEKSDIDLLIVGDVKQTDIIGVISDFERKTLREINYIIWDEAEFREKIKVKHHLLKDIGGKPVIMLVGNEHEFRKSVE